MNFNFLIQATKVITIGAYDESELELILNFLIAADEELLSELNDTCSLISYDNDLMLFLEILEALLVIYEDREEYEICEIIKNKIDDVHDIINKKTI